MSPGPLNPSTFGISSKKGYLSDQNPLHAFENVYYQPWDDLNEDLASLIRSGRLAERVQRLPLLDIGKLDGDLEYRRAYVVLGFLTHGYIWSSNPPCARVPPQLSDPFLAVCRYLGMEPVLSYAGLCIWNWGVRHGDHFDLPNMVTLASFTGKPGEDAFYLVPVLVEQEGGALMHLLVKAVYAAAKGNSETVQYALETTAQTIVRTGKQLSKLYATLEADFFYHELRPFLSGGKGMEEKGLPDGVIFERSDGSALACKYAGGSAVQSSLFPFLDRVLGIVHADMTVYEESLAYMPGEHRDFLEQVSRLPSIRSHVEASQGNESLVKAFNDCMKEARAWRGKHMAIVSKYIVQPAREAQRAPTGNKPDSDVVNGEDDDAALQGTGGSALMPFLRQARDATIGIGT